MADLHACWRALLGGSILPPELVALATETVTAEAELGMGYGRGMYIPVAGLVRDGLAAARASFG